MPPKHVTLLGDDQWPNGGFTFELPLDQKTAALGVIDVQGYATNSDGHLACTVQRHSAQLQQEFSGRAEGMIDNILQLLSAFRQNQQRVFFTRHGGQLSDGADLIQRRRNREAAALVATGQTSGHLASKGDTAYEIDTRLAPRSDELVLDKNTSSAFHSTPIDLYLRNMKIETLFLTGVAADQCVLATAIDAADRGFHVVIVNDACANLDPGSAEATQILFGRVWGYVMQTRDVLEWIATGKPPERTRLKA